MMSQSAQRSEQNPRRRRLGKRIGWQIIELMKMVLSGEKTKKALGGRERKKKRNGKSGTMNYHALTKSNLDIRTSNQK